METRPGLASGENGGKEPLAPPPRPSAIPRPPEPVPLSLAGAGALAVNLSCALARDRRHSGSLTQAAFPGPERRTRERRDDRLRVRRRAITNPLAGELGKVAFR
jgi:hypothetical protein